MPNVDDFMDFFREKDQIPSISQVRTLKHFIESYPNEDLIANFLQLEKDYKHYRAIKGDGNCFYRAIMFQYLCEAELHHFQHLFPPADLFACQNRPFGRPAGFTSENLLRFIWEEYLLPLSDKDRFEREKHLVDILNDSCNLDAALICYLRVLNYNHLRAHSKEYQDYGDVDVELKRILIFAQESEGTELYTLPDVLRAEVTVLMVHPQNYLQFNINYNHNFSKNFIVTYRPGHYDIPIRNYDPTQYPRSSVNSQAPRSSTFGSSTLSKLIEKKNRDNVTLKPKERASFPRVIEVQRPSEVKRITIKNPVAHKRAVSSGAEVPTTLLHKPPSNMNQFKKSRISHTFREETEPECKEEVKEEAGESVSKIPKTILRKQREEARSKQQCYEASLVGFMSLMLLLAFFIM